MLRSLSILLCAVLLASPLGAPLGAQRILGPSDDGVPLPRGMVRWTIAGTLSLARDQWHDGTLEGLGGRFEANHITDANFLPLTTLAASLRAAGLSPDRLSFGAPSLALRRRSFATPVGFEVGILDRLTVGLSVPWVRNRAEGDFRIDGDPLLANVGINPIRRGTDVAASNRNILAQFDSAAARLNVRRAQCSANPASSSFCPTILAEGAQITNLLSTTGAFRTNLGAAYAGAYAPRAGSTIERAIEAQMTVLGSAYTRYGIAGIAATPVAPRGAQTPLSRADLDTLLTDPDDGFGARPLRSSARTALGDTELSARYTLYDGFTAELPSSGGGWRPRLRQTVGAAFRIGSGTAANAADLLDQDIGEGADSYELRSATDLAFGRGIWATIGVRWRRPLSTDRELRLPGSATDPWLESWRTALVSFTPGATTLVELTPRWQLNDYLALAGSWSWRQRGAAEASYRADRSLVDPTPRPLPATLEGLSAGSAQDEQRVGFGATYSTLYARSRGKARRAFDLSWMHRQSISSTTGTVPKQWEDAFQLRVYTRLFGGR